MSPRPVYLTGVFCYPKSNITQLVNVIANGCFMVRLVGGGTQEPHLVSINEVSEEEEL